MAKKKIQKLINKGAEITGQIYTGVIGQYLGGMEGAIIGGIYGPIIAGMITRMGKEFGERHLGQRGEIRVGAVLTYALLRIKEEQEKGRTVRDDGFFDDLENGKPSDANEILEGILLLAQKSYQEKKLQIIANIYASAAFEKSLDKGWCNFYINLAERMSFRQFCLLQVYNNKDKYIPDREIDMSKDSFMIIRMDIMSELYQLQDMGLLGIKSIGFYGPTQKKVIQVPPEYITITKSGTIICEILGLNEINLEDISNEAGFIMTKRPNPL